MKYLCINQRTKLEVPSFNSQEGCQIKAGYFIIIIKQEFRLVDSRP